MDDLEALCVLTNSRYEDEKEVVKDMICFQIRKSGLGKFYL